jgi:hypothetical protein
MTTGLALLATCRTCDAVRYRVKAAGDGRLAQQLHAKRVQHLAVRSVVSVFRLAIGEAVRVPEVARTLDRVGRGTVREALTAIVTQGRSLGVLSGRPADLIDQITGLLWSDLMLSLLLGVVEQPGAAEVTRRARAAVSAFLQLQPPRAEAHSARARRVRSK